MSKSLHSRQRPVVPSAAPVQPDRTPVAYALPDLAVAPENLRFAEPPDDGIGELAETIFAAGVLQPLTVRPGRGREHAGMVLDGRRRLLALGLLLEAGRIADDYPVSCFVETDAARQAAAAVLTNTAVPVHVADVIVAIGKMLKAKLTIPAVAGALGYGELEVRRLAALSELHPKAIEALKAGRCSLRQARLLARLPDRDVQGEVAAAALNGFGFQEWRVAERLDAGQVTIHDRRFAFVGPDGYAAAGGRLESDLFGERADVVLDPDRLQAAWTARAEAIAQALADGSGWQVHVSVDELEIDDETLEPFGYGYGMDLEGEDREAWRTATAVTQASRDALRDRDLADPSADADIAAFLVARLAADRAEAPGRAVSLVAVFADATTGLDVRAWGPPDPVCETDLSDGEAPQPSVDGPGDGEDAPRAAGAAATPLAIAPPVELEGVNHGLHELRTDVATRALIRALADHPPAALVAVTARLFCLLALRQGLGKGGGALSLGADAYGRLRTPPIAALDGDVRRRLAERRVAWSASGLTPIAWVLALDETARLALLAELVALSLDLREERTTSVRAGARAEAAEIAALCHADVARHWTPDASFLGAHPKGRLLAMLDEMGARDPQAGGARKDELVALVAARAAERRWAPADLSWAAAPPMDGEDPAPDAADAAPDAAAAGTGTADEPAAPPPTA